MNVEILKLYENRPQYEEFLWNEMGGKGTAFWLMG